MGSRGTNKGTSKDTNRATSRAISRDINTVYTSFSIPSIYTILYI